MDEREVDALIDDLEASYEGLQDAPVLRRRLLDQLPDTAATWAQRARLTLLGVDDLVRDHGAAGAAQTVVEIRDHAAASGSRALHIRAARALSWLLRKVGDPSVALEHAVAALALDGDDTDAALRCRVRVVLADALGECGSLDEARTRYREALEHARCLTSPWLSLIVLNNWAWAELDAGEVGVSAGLVEQMQAVADQHHVSLYLMAAETVAEVLHARGRSEQAVAVLRRHLHEPREHAPIAAAGAWLTLARIERGTGDLVAAGTSLDSADALTTRYAIHVLTVEGLGERAELLAARGDHAGAYATHLRFHDQTLALRSAAADARARTQHAMLQADTARREAARYRKMSHRDPLTQLLNRRHVDEDLDARLARGAPLAVAMVDLDHFKTVNDTCSHQAGDAVLVRIATLLTDAVAETPGAYAARLGGEEFLLVLPHHDLAGAHAVAEGLRRRIAAHDWTDIAPSVPVTASTGLATTTAGAPLDRAALLRTADHHLYAAKAAGRDRVEPAHAGSAPEIRLPAAPAARE